MAGLELESNERQRKLLADFERRAREQEAEQIARTVAANKAAVDRRAKLEAVEEAAQIEGRRMEQVSAHTGS